MQINILINFVYHKCQTTNRPHNEHRASISQFADSKPSRGRQNFLLVIISQYSQFKKGCPLPLNLKLKA
jgi:hypothetical protein